jgi:type IV secretion system protein TrbG
MTHITARTLMKMLSIPIAYLLLLPAACASRSQPPPRYVKAQFVAEPTKPPAVITVPKPLPLPGQLRLLPARHASQRTAAGKQPAAVVQEANAKATSSPDPAGYYNAIMVFDYAPGVLFRIYTAPLRFTAIQLQPGEKVLGKVVIGDNIRWATALGKSQAGQVEQFIVYLKPTRPDLSTTMTINTDRRSYFLELTSWPNDYMVAVAWRYPQDEVAQIEAAAEQQEAADKAVTATLVRLDAANFAYSIKVEKGRPVWTPLQAFDDGTRTFIRFPVAMLKREAPAFFVLDSTGQVQIVNVRVKNEYYIVDRLFERAELRVGQQDQEIVRISRDR